MNFAFSDRSKFSEESFGIKKFKKKKKIYQRKQKTHLFILIEHGLVVNKSIEQGVNKFDTKRNKSVDKVKVDGISADSDF